MSFGLKNARATFQWMVNYVFKDLINHATEVNVDDILVKSLHRDDHLRHLGRVFALLRAYNVKLNSEKCTFGVALGKFSGYLITQRDIEANADQIDAIKELQMLNGWLTA